LWYPADTYRWIAIEIKATMNYWHCWRVWSLRDYDA
jgi:hypothetical protein